MRKTIYISGPISDNATGQPRPGWKPEFNEIEKRLLKNGFDVINPVRLSEALEAMRGTATLTRADYIMHCLDTMNRAHKAGMLHGVLVIGDSIQAIVASCGVRMEMQLAAALGIPVFIETVNGLHVTADLKPDREDLWLAPWGDIVRRGTMKPE